MKRAFQILRAGAVTISVWAALWGCSTKNQSPTLGSCSSNAQCLNGEECSGGRCVPFTSCPAVACGSGQSCVAGVCRAACSRDSDCGALICDELKGSCQPAPNPVGNGGTSSIGTAGSAASTA